MLDKLKNGHLVWDILTPEEQASISLQIIEDKSTWQAGSILDKSHYKYLEIYTRAKEYIRLFTGYFKEYDELVPSEVHIDKNLKEYFINVIQKRMSIIEATEDLGSSISKAKNRKKLILDHYKKWAKSPYRDEQKFLELLLHFDAWNNFRILPREIQEPHAFKRRNKNRYKQHINLMMNIPEYTLDRFFRMITKGKVNTPEMLYVPIITDNEIKCFSVFPIDNNPRNVNLINSMALYYFGDEYEATVYMEHIIEPFLQKKSCKQGLDFWPKYRAAIRQAINYDQQQNIIPNRKYYDLIQRDDKEIKEILTIREEKLKITKPKENINRGYIRN